MIIYSGGILKSGTAIGITPACCCGGVDPCCFCAELSPTGTKYGSLDYDTAIDIDLVFSAYEFCTDDNITITMTVTNLSFINRLGTPLLFINTPASYGSNWSLVSTTPAHLNYSQTDPVVNDCGDSYGTQILTWPDATIPALGSSTFEATFNIIYNRPDITPPTYIGGQFLGDGFSRGWKGVDYPYIDVYPCPPDPEPEPCTCCFELVPWSAGECDKSEVPGFVDDIGLTAVGVSVDPWCNGATLTLTLTFTNASGFDNSGAEITFDLSSIGTTVTCTSASDGGVITPGFSVVWTAGAWANGVSLVRTLQMTHSGCIPGIGSITSEAYTAAGYRCSVGWLPVACPPI